MMMGTTFLLPLYLTDLYDLSAATIGLLATTHSIALFVSIRAGGSFADRWPNRRLAVGGLIGQSCIMGYFFFLPDGLSLAWIVAGVITHGLAAGSSLAALHRTALESVIVSQTGAAAGIRCCCADG